MPDIFLLTPSLWNEDNSNPLSKIFHTNPSNYSIRPYANYMDNLLEFKFDKQIYKFM